MRTIQLTNLIKDQYNLTNVFPNTIPDIRDTLTGVYSYASDSDRYIASGIARYQFLTVGMDRQLTEDYSCMLIDMLSGNTITGTILSKTEILNVHVLQLQPMYLGADELGRHKWSFNIELEIQQLKTP